MLFPAAVCNHSAATEALMAIGYSRQEAVKAVSSVANPPDDAEALIKLALKNLF